jgi:putative transposase
MCPTKYRKVLFSKEVDETLMNVCLEIEKRYDVHFMEIGTDKNHVHFLIQSVPKLSATAIITMIKIITAKEIFKSHPEVKTKLWGGEF